MKVCRCMLKVSFGPPTRAPDRKSTRLNSSHQIISYAVFCLKKKNIKERSRLSWESCRISCPPNPCGSRGLWPRGVGTDVGAMINDVRVIMSLFFFLKEPPPPDSPLFPHPPPLQS